MDRNDFLKLCRENTMYPGTVKVKHRDIVYYPYGLQITFGTKGEALNTALLKDLKANSLTCADINEVKKI